MDALWVPAPHAPHAGVRVVQMVAELLLRRRGAEPRGIWGNSWRDAFTGLRGGCGLGPYVRRWNFSSSFDGDIKDDLRVEGGEGREKRGGRRGEREEGREKRGGRRGEGGD